MANKRNVLVFSGATYPAMQIIDCLKSSLLFHTIAAASYPNHSEFVCDDAAVNLPFIRDTSFLETFIQFVKERNIDFVIPTDESIALLLKKHEDSIPATIVCSPYETAVLCRYKKLAYQALQGEGFTPEIYAAEALDAIETYPVFIKPDESQGSRGARIISCREEFAQVDDLSGMVISEYLPGEEYTVDCFTNRDRKLIFCNPRVRTRLMNGITARGHNVPCTKEFQEVIETLNQKVHFRGYWYVQLKRDRQGRLKLLEICTRFAGSFAISKGLGVNLPLLALCDFAGQTAEVITNNYVVECDKTYIDRYRLSMTYNHVYVDYDDTVTSNNGASVNPYVIAYLYQCRNRHVRITLLTRHTASFDEPLTESMDRLGLSAGLFDEVIDMPWDQEKVEAIKEPADAIFIDNSFAERKKVHDALGMPVFDVSNMDCLFDWRQ